ncbi:MAG: SPFH domain-containing protein [Bacteroidales bacterium]|nr:SPFH domain-containing protein [Bacteroidales bacterium]
MGLFDKKPKKEIINEIKWTDEKAVVLFPFDCAEREIAPSAKLVVAEKQVAVFVKIYNVLNIYETGTHPIKTSDIKRIQEEEVYVYFVTTELIPIVRWRTPNVRFKSREYDFSGTYSFQIKDIQKFTDNILANSDVKMSESDLFKKIEDFINQIICKTIFDSGKTVDNFSSDVNLQAVALETINKEITKGGIEISSFDPQIEEEYDEVYSPKQVISFISPKKQQLVTSCTDLQTKYSTIINKTFSTLMANKSKDDVFTLSDGENIVTALLAVVKKDYKKIPPEIKVACDLSLAIIAPSTLEKTKYIKSAVGVAGGVAGIGMVLGALGTVLGWGAGVLWSIKTFFVGVSLGGPTALVIGGLTIAGIATYFAFSKDDNATLAQKFKEALVKQTEKAVETTWNQYKSRFE